MIFLVELLQQLHMLVRGRPDLKNLSSNIIRWREVVRILKKSPAMSYNLVRGSLNLKTLSSNFICWWQVVQIFKKSLQQHHLLVWGSPGFKKRLLQQCHMLMRGGPNLKKLSSIIICWREVVQIRKISPTTSYTSEKRSS